jgi:hypothetical protein
MCMHTGRESNRKFTLIELAEPEPTDRENKEESA